MLLVNLSRIGSSPEVNETTRNFAINLLRVEETGMDLIKPKTLIQKESQHYATSKQIIEELMF